MSLHRRVSFGGIDTDTSFLTTDTFGFFKAVRISVESDSDLGNISTRKLPLRTSQTLLQFDITLWLSLKNKID